MHTTYSVELNVLSIPGSVLHLSLLLLLLQVCEACSETLSAADAASRCEELRRQAFAMGAYLGLVPKDPV